MSVVPVTDNLVTFPPVHGWGSGQKCFRLITAKQKTKTNPDFLRGILLKKKWSETNKVTVATVKLKSIQPYFMQKFNPIRKGDYLTFTQQDLLY